MACIPKFHGATILDLRQIPGMKDETAETILKYRDQKGPISDFDQLSEIKGVDSHIIDGLKDCLTNE